MQHNTILRVVLAALCILAATRELPAQGLKKIRWGQTSIGASQWIPWIAKDMKFYEKNGLDMEIILLRGSGQTSQAMIGGSIFASPVTTATLMTANLSGADLTTVAHTVSVVQGRMLVKPEIRKAEDLKGKKVASSGLGSLGDFMYRVIMRKYGLNPDKDINWITVGTPPERLQALAAGSVDAADLSYPSDVRGEKMGFRVLWDARAEVPYPSMSVVTRKKTIQEDRDGVMRMMRAHVEGIHFLKTQKEASLKILAKYLRTDDRELLDGSYDIYSKDFIPTPYPIVTGLKLAYEQVAQRRPEIYNHKPEEFVDASFVSELDKSGFIKKLYAQR
jgi:ABC-type nitrate/sulfonate/bicarbonate transport system substrate-binding protein